MKAAKTQKKLKEMPYPSQKSFQKDTYIITPAKANAPFSQTFSEGLKFPIQTYQMRKKELKLKLG